jgi:hypothetical protein
MTAKKIEIRLASKSSQGNIYAILGLVQRAMRKAQLITAYNDLRDDVLNAGSYDEAIKRIRQTVDLVDTDGKI